MYSSEKDIGMNDHATLTAKQYYVPWIHSLTDNIIQSNIQHNG